MPIFLADIDKSIQQNRVKYRFTWDMFINYLFTYVIGGLLIIACIAPNFNNKIRHPLGITLLFGIFAVWLISNLLLLNRLVIINGTNIKTNKAIINAVLESFFGDVTFENSGRVIRNVKLQHGLRLGRILTVFLDGDKIYLNITTLGRANTPSPFHGLYNYLKCKMIARRFKNFERDNPNSVQSQ